MRSNPTFCDSFRKPGRPKGALVIAGTVFAVSAFSGCTVGPQYKRPAVDVPSGYRDLGPAAGVPDNASLSIGDLKWSEIFRDPQLKALIQEAIERNYDVRIAAQRILEQQARVGITRSESLPSIEAGGAYTPISLPSSMLGNGESPHFYGGGFVAAGSWHLDFWGLYRRQNEAARAELLATEWGHRATQSSVVIQVASFYIQLRSLDDQREITRATIESRKESLRLVSLRESVGSTSMADVHQAEQLLHAAEAVLPELERQIHVQENEMSLLLGRSPGPIQRSKRPAGLPYPNPEEIPAGLPAQLLERRPDIRRIEDQLIAANARIGVARAQFFPQISLTALGGTWTDQFDQLFASNATYWLAVGQAIQPIFTAGRLKNNLKLTEETQKEMVLTYQQTIASAFRDVADALIAHQKSRENRIAQEKEVNAARESVRLAQIRYENGRSSYLEVLTNETNLFAAQLNLAGVQQAEALSLVQLYGALGGGWK